MTMALPASEPRTAAGVGRPALLLGCICLVALYVFCHPYAGLGGDASIYMMRALADLDPARLGHDLMVADDGQMRFSLFPRLVRPIVAALGASQAAMLVAALGSAAWLAALAALAFQLAPGRIAVAMVSMVAVLPQGYGGFGLFSFAETAATPRPLAEAAVMAAFAALLAGRSWLALATLVVAALIHPIMAAPGISVVVLVLLWRLPVRARLAVAALTALATFAAFGLGLAGVPPFDRLVARPDPEWLALLRLHSPQLFPTLWAGESFAPPLAQAATMVVAAHRASASRRPLFLAALAVGAAGMAAAVMLGDALHLLVFIQAQTWRATWLVGVLGGCALAYCTAMLWPDARGRLVLALLAIAWFVQPTPALTLAVAGLAVLLELDMVGPRLQLTFRQAGIVLVATALLSSWWASGTILGYLAYLRDLPPGGTPSLLAPLRNNMESLPLTLAIAAWLVAPPGRFARLCIAALAILCVGLIAADLLAWDQRSVAQAALERPRDPPGLAALAAGRKLDVLWLDDEFDAWFALERPQYVSREQAVSMVFSRKLALEWARRADVLIGLGLAPKSIFTPQRPAADDDRARITQPAIDAFCARPDAPGLILVPREGGAPQLRDMVVWPLPSPLSRPERFVSSTVERRIVGFGIVPCAASLPR